MRTSLRSTIVRAAALGAVALLGASPLTAGADPQPSYSTGGAQPEAIQGTIYQITSRYTLTLQDDRGFIDSVTIRNGTIITPTGLSLGSGQVATILGHTDGKTFDADEVDVDPSTISSGQPVLPGGDYSTIAGYAGDYPAYAFGYDGSYGGYAASSGYIGPYAGGYSPGYYPGYAYGNGYGGANAYYPPQNGGQPGTPRGGEPISRRPVRVGGNPPPGYSAPTGGSRIGSPPVRVAPPSFHSAPVFRSAPAPAPAQASRR